MVLGKYIKLLLDERKRVILPGFGNLEVKESTGALPDQEGVFNPPGLGITFDAGYSKDDGVLASELSMGERLDEEEARQKVLELVDAIKFALDKGEPYTLPEAGSFTRDSNGKVHFRIDRNWVLEPGQYGLEPLNLLELDETVEIEEVPLEPVQIEADESFAVEPQKSEPPPYRQASGTAAPRVAVRQAYQKEHRPGRWRAVWIVAGVLIVVLVVLIMVPSNKLNIPGKKPPPPVVNMGPDPSLNTTQATGEGEIDNPSDFESLTPESLENEPAEAIEKPEQPAVRNKYFLIAGSFSHLKNASDLQDRLKAKGVETDVMITDNRMYRVSVGSYPTMGEAEKELDRVKSLSGLESCWILSN
jgi:nucleoid DNA-binding protein